MDLGVNFSRITNINLLQKKVSFYGKTNQCDTFEKQKSEDKKQQDVDFKKLIERRKKSIFKNFCSDIKGDLDDFSIENKQLTPKEKEIISVYNDVVKELNIPKEYQPKIYLIPFSSDKNILGGGYQPGLHSIILNSNYFNNPNFDIENVLMHEMTHCNEKIKRASISQKRVHEIIVNELIKRIKIGENFTVPIGITKSVHSISMKPPVFSESMKKDFINFAKNTLYKPKHEFSDSLDEYFDKKMSYKDLAVMNINGKLDKNEREILNGVVELNKKHPEFKLQYNSEEKAISELFNYAISHQSRYTTYTSTSIINCDGNVLKVKELKGNEQKSAEKSLANFIETAEANWNVVYCDKNIQNIARYQFCYEEALAQINGNSYLIKCLNKKLDKMRANNTLNKEEEINIQQKIKKAEKIISIMKNRGIFFDKNGQVITDENKISTILQDFLKNLSSQSALLAH